MTAAQDYKIEKTKVLARDTIVKLVRKFGSLAADAILDPATKIFATENIEGYIAYREESNCAIVYGDPVCSIDDRKELIESFKNFCENQHFAIVYLITSTAFTKWALDNGFGCSIEYGEELYLDPHNDPRALSGSNAQLVRRKVRHAEKENVTIHEYTESDPDLEKTIESVAEQWLKNRQGPQIHISNIWLFNDRYGKRWFYAKQNDKVIGTVILNRLESKKGWLINHLMITPEAPNGTTEMLVVHCLDILRHEDCHYVTFGNVPAQKIVEITGFSFLKNIFIKLLYFVSKKVFRLETRKMFWEKFNPVSEKSYLLFQKPEVGMNELRGLMAALNVSLGFRN